MSLVMWNHDALSRQLEKIDVYNNAAEMHSSLQAIYHKYHI